MLRYLMETTIFCVFLFTGSCVNGINVTAFPNVSSSVPNSNVPSPLSPSLIYSVNESLTDFDTLIEANSFACGRYYFCNSTHGEYERSLPCAKCGPCHCDSKCHDFGDCCADLGGTQKKHKLPWMCVKRLDTYMEFDVQFYAFMVSSCTEAGNRHENTKDNGRKCEHASETNIDEVTPVTDLLTNVTYRNRFCAACNGVTDVTLWTLHVECEVGAIPTTGLSREELARRVLTSNECIVRDIPPPGVYIRECHDTYVRTCDVSLRGNYSSVSERLCYTSSGAPVTVSTKTYRNVFCALCNGILLDRYCDITPDGLPGYPGYPGYPGLKVLLDLNPKSSDHDTGKDDIVLSDSCPKNESYDPVTEKCLPVKCPHKRLYTDGICQPVYVTADDQVYELLLKVALSSPLDTRLVQDLVVIFVDHLKEEWQEYRPIRRFSGEYREILINSTGEGHDDNTERASGFFLNITLASASDDSLSDTEDKLRVLGDRVDSLTVDGQNVSLRTESVQCLDSLLKSTSGLLAREPLPVGISFCWMPNGCTFEVVSLFSTLDCPQIETNISEIKHSYDGNNLTLYINNTLVKLNRSSHLYCKGMLKICRNALSDIQQQLGKLNASSALGLVSVVCLSLSLVSLLLTFTIFCLLRQLRTLPGKNTMALTLHLFFAQLLFQVGINATDDVTTCRVMGIVIHYTWLATFGWMAVSAYHMYAAFTNMSLISTAGSGNGHARVLFKYTCICHLLALIFVSGCLGYNLATSAGEIFGYGRKKCFIDEPFDIGLFFALPLAIILVFNTVCFVKTVLAIRSVPDMKSARNKVNKTHLNAYCRLSVLLGFTWVFGFVASALQSDVFWYLFVILNGLQGVFIALAYCANKRILDMLKTRLEQKPASTATVSTNVTKSSSHLDTQSSKI